jgi:cytochrome c oxidase subunit IV
MSEHAAHAHTPVPSRTFIWIWVWLVVLTAIEVVLAYFHLPVLIMMLLLLGLSFIKAGLIMAYFMHLKFEKFQLVLVIASLLLCIGLMGIFFPDSLRLLHMR